MAAWLLVSALVLFLPFLAFAVALLNPVLFAGLMLACRDQTQGKKIGPSYLFRAFKESKSVVRQLLLFGLLELALGALIAVAMHLLGMQPMSFDIKDADDAIKARQVLFDQAGFFALFLAIKMTTAGALWFVTPLLVFGTMPLSHALRWNFFALLSNIMPMLLFGVLMLVLLIVASIPFALGMIILMPVMAISNYTSYQRVFSE